MNAIIGDLGSDLTVAVVVASLGRPELIGQIHGLIDRQTCPADVLVFSVVGDADVPEGLEESERVWLLKGRKGLCAQRNTALDALKGAYDLVVFYDDDFVPSRHSIEQIKQFFIAHPEVVGATGNVIRDGINGAGISFEDAQELVAQHEERNFSPNCIVTGLDGLYGCNMAYRSSAIGSARFDERLSLYGWQEDVDFAASISRHGRLVKTFAFAGVHRGVKFGRTSGVRLGYSQVINPSYLVKKGTMSKRFAGRLIIRNVLANHVKCLRPEPWVDRAGRAKGNWIGMFDLMRGRLTPERIEGL
ncbi:glycosyltransferase family 2 protein [Novosphingobium sp.]|uniref:glycosyltransferase family 2 protein n=1 Tax=Novosphingobium sp. TaxID=1874826 RepID=UPI00163DCCF0|nr:glycosyltransferase family 2 protein [Novosphingobium sp.]